jgi:type II secretion system protein N
VKQTGFPIHQEAGVLFSGTIVKGQLQRSIPTRKPAENRLSAELDNAVLSVMGQPLNLGKITIEGSGQGNNLRIATLTANGGDVTISGNGMLLIGASAAASHINLDLTLRPARTASPSMAALLDLAANRQSDGSYRLRLNGSLGKPTVEKLAATVGRPVESVDDE